jgi:hypothetical protein
VTLEVAALSLLAATNTAKLPLELTLALDALLLKAALGALLMPSALTHQRPALLAQTR